MCVSQEETGSREEAAGCCAIALLCVLYWGYLELLQQSVGPASAGVQEQFGHVSLLLDSPHESAPLADSLQKSFLRYTKTLFPEVALWSFTLCNRTNHACVSGTVTSCQGLLSNDIITKLWHHFLCYVTPQWKSKVCRRLKKTLKRRWVLPEVLKISKKEKSQWKVQ